MCVCVSQVERLVEISSTCAIKEWRRLPMIVSQVHVSLLQVMVGCVTQCSRLVTLRLPSPQQSTHVHCTRSAVTATELLQPRDLACGTLFQSSCLILTSLMDRTFAAAGTRLWNSLPVQLRNPDITRRQLKGHLFGKHEHGAL